MGRHKFLEAIWEFSHLRNGKVLWKKEGRNSLTNQGEQVLLSSFFRDQDSPAEFYVGFCNQVIHEDYCLANITEEPEGNGYARLLVERSAVGYPILELYEGDYVIYTKYLTLVASGGDIGPVMTAFLATTNDNSGYLLSFINLDTSLIIYDGDDVTFRIRIRAM